MSNDDQEYEEVEVDCEVCEEPMIIDSYMEKDDVVTCEECGAEYLIESRDPLILEVFDEDDDDDDIDYYEDDYS